MNTIKFDDKPVAPRQLANELKALSLADNAFAGISHTDRRVQEDGTVVTENASIIEVKFRAEISAADKLRVKAVVDAHVPAAAALTRREELAEKNNRYKMGRGPRLPVEELRELTELTL
jgi:hypothetical protein